MKMPVVSNLWLYTLDKTLEKLTLLGGANLGAARLRPRPPYAPLLRDSPRPSLRLRTRRRVERRRPLPR